uniref:GNAT family N-acetyltransferase n=1 Tax=Pedobacter schmidteae TaxID=2201271 RepID=UPI000EABB53B|nr:GNAT family N-acetyltransferase [Pedobacter schmidteae]
MIAEKPVLLTDKTRLQEIFELRVNAYEHSPFSQYINHQNAPNGLFDDLDFSPSCYHWIIESGHKIIASCRLSMVRDLKDISENFWQLGLPQKGSSAFYSRLVVDKDYRNHGLANLMDQARIEFIRAHKEEFLTLAWAREDRVPALLKLGFEYQAAITVKVVDAEEPATALKFVQRQY